MVRWLIKHVPFLDRLLVEMDRLWGYDKQDLRHKWWFDLEYRDGRLQSPERF